MFICNIGEERAISNRVGARQKCNREVIISGHLAGLAHLVGSGIVGIGGVCEVLAKWSKKDADVSAKVFVCFKARFKQL